MENLDNETIVKRIQQGTGNRDELLGNPLEPEYPPGTENHTRKNRAGPLERPGL